MNIKLILILALVSILTACTTPGFFEFNAVMGAYYTGAEPVNERKQFFNSPNHIWFGPYRIREMTGGFTGLIEFYDKGNLPGEQINAWWQVHYKDKADKYFYARSLPDQGIQAPDMHFWSDWKYYAYISFGPMYINTLALNEDQKESEYLKLVEVSKWSGMHFYSWGKESSLYYSVTKDYVDPQREPRNWIEVPGIAITAEQFELLDKRCGKPWLKTRCFLDESFPDLTPVQLAYIQAHEHQDDAYWLSDKAKPPKVKEKVNYWL
jgi:hypothetical protein